jgi:serine phosphatase RsbU (regulator of sigma subunit)
LLKLTISICLLVVVQATIPHAATGDTLFISAENLKAGDFYIAAPGGGTSEEILWRFSPGDDSLWADTHYDDSGWELVNPWLDVFNPGTSQWNGIGWFRKVVHIDSSLKGKNVGVYLHQDGASEVFLNGKKIFAFGKVSNNKAKESFYNPGNSPYVFAFDSSTVYTFAVRYSNHSHLGWEYFYNKFFGHLGFSIALFDFNNTIESRMMTTHERTAFDWGINGFTLAFSLIFFLLYFFYSKRKQNLYFALFVFGIALISTSTDLQFFRNPDLELIVIYRIVQFIAFSFVFTFFLLFIYETVYNRIIKLFWLFFTAFIFINGFAFFGARGIFDNMMPLAIIISIMTIESLRVFVVGIMRKVENIWILAFGGIVFLMLVLFNFFIVSLLQESVLDLIMIPIMILTITILPITMAIYLAKSYGKTQTDLQEQILVVRELSEKQIEQEKLNAELQLKAEIERMENERKSKELEKARQLQLSMLPKELPVLENLDIAVYMKTATEVGGDYYDFSLSEDKIFTAVLGDATGHGLDAGMLVSVSKGLFQNLVRLTDIKTIISQFNSSLLSMKLQPMYMSLCFVRIIENELKIIGAGMPPALYYNCEKGTIDEIESNGPPLGVLPNINYSANIFKLSKGDILVLLSDGFAERQNENNEMLGWQEASKLLLKSKNLTSEQIINEFVKSSDTWAGNREQNDDITFVVLKVK